jgi:GTP-binding protein Era
VVELEHSGFAAIIGRPSTGKSTFINTLTGCKVSIVSPIPQTTRNRVRAIHNGEGFQVVFVDTPGIHISERGFNQTLLDQASRAIAETEAVLCLLDLSRPFGAEDKGILEMLIHHAPKTVIGLNKADIAPPGEAEKRQAEVTGLLEPAAWRVFSARDREQCLVVAEAVTALLPAGPRYYPEDHYTDQAQEFRITEIVREKVFLHTRDEVPHGTYVSVETIDYDEERDRIRIEARINVENESQKGILIGKGGEMIRRLGSEARADLEDIFGRDVDLFLKVKVHPHWRKDERLLKKMF